MTEKTRLPSRKPGAPIDIAIVCLPASNAFATVAFLDPLRAAIYLSGQQLWVIDGGLTAQVQQMRRIG